MTVGEKIQYYRKNQGLSQEDLGQKLMVSRQTISLWEMDKTVPSIDNLIRLKDIFGVSIDDILCGGKVEVENADRPLESYSFTYTKDEMKRLFKYSARIMIRNIIFTLPCLILMIFGMFNADAFYTGFAAGVIFLAVVSYISAFIRFANTKKAGMERMSQSTYTYDVFKYFFKVTINQPDKSSNLTVKSNDIKKVSFTDKYVIIQVGNELFSIKRSLFPEDSRLFTILRLATAKNPPRAKTKCHILSIILFIASILSLFFAIGTVGAVTAYNQSFNANMWLFFLYLPIPIASIVFYSVLKRRGIVFKKNLIVGIIMSAFLCIYGSFVLFPEQMSVNEEYEASVEQILAEDYSEPDVIKIFSLEKADVHIETICIFKSEDKGLVVGALYTYEDEDKTYFQEFESNVQIGERYYSAGCTSDYDIGYQIYATRKDAPDISYELQEITVDGEKYYFCVGYVGYYMSDETHWVTE